ncbi:MAG: excinuclease ABC subunit UvrC [Clostridia bacterium]
MSHDAELLAKVRNLPDRPGVYLMKDADDVILYIGKALSLRSRVRSYFQDPSRLLTKVAALMRHVADLEVIVTDTEVEALILEATLVKRHQPKYNIHLKDDKAYPYLRITWEEPFPRLLVARRPADDGGRYFGPFPRAGTVRETIRLLRRVFPIRNCSNQKFKTTPRPCLEYHIGRCQGPCHDLVTQEEYRTNIKRVERLLDGHGDEVMDDLRQRLEDAAEALEFEKAAELRDQLKAVEAITAPQKVASTAGRELDAINWAVFGPTALVHVFTIRDGRLVGRQQLELKGVEDWSDVEIVHAFLTQYYQNARLVPREVLLPAAPEDQGAMERWLSDRRGRSVHLTVPRRGEKARLLAMVGQNAEWSRNEARRRVEIKEDDRANALLGIQHSLGLDALPKRMECYDISNTQGTESVASMVVFTDGRPDKSQYRRFKIRTVEGPDDFSSMAEVIRRRFTHREIAEQQGRPDLKRFAQFPDLVIVDGGRGQLSAAVAVLEEIGVKVPIFGLAKQHEWLFQPASPEPIILDWDSAALKLLRHLRDEAHRFAITFHRKLRTRRNLRSLLDDIPGIGPKRKRALLAAYPNLDAIRSASDEELAQVPGMTSKAAEAVSRFFRAEASS